MNRTSVQGCPPGLPRGLVFLLMLLLPLPAVADGPVTFCYADWPPYTQTKDGTVRGITAEIIRQAASALGREIRFVEREWDDCLERVKSGEFDAILDAARRDAYLQGPTSFNSYIDTFWVTNASQINRYDQLRGGRIALVKGYNYDERLHAHLRDLDAEVVRGIDDPTIIRDLATGKLDASVADLASTFYVARKENLNIVPILPPFSEDRLYTSFYAGRPEVQREFDRAIAQLLENGFVDEVYKKYIGISFSSFNDRN